MQLSRHHISVDEHPGISLRKSQLLNRQFPLLLKVL
jgi:hypothetical protein